MTYKDIGRGAGKTITMSTTADPVFQRRNKQIQEAIDAQNFKQALQLIDKRIKKGENTRFLRVSLCYELFWFISFLDGYCANSVLSLTGVESAHPLPTP